MSGLNGLKFNVLCVNDQLDGFGKLRRQPTGIATTKRCPYRLTNIRFCRRVAGKYPKQEAKNKTTKYRHGWLKQGSLNTTKGENYANSMQPVDISSANRFFPSLHLE